MNIFYLSLRNMVNRPLSTTLSLVLLTLGVGMISLLLAVNHHIQQQMENNIRGIDMVVGAKGSPLQLILSAVYHIDAPTGNISQEEAKLVKNNRLVDSAIPLAYGDNYEGYRIVGTDHAYPTLYKATISEGVLWEKPFEVSLGATVANNLGLKIGDNFASVHGLGGEGESHGDHLFEVVGIFNYSNSVLDQLILTPIESIWLVHNHDDREEEIAHDDDTSSDHQEDALTYHGDHSGDSHDDEAQHDHHVDREITAMLVKFKNPMGLVQLPRTVNEDTNMQSAVPAYEIYRLFSLLGVGVDTLSAIALVIMAVSGLSVFISLYNALRDRKYEMALMRSYGATRWQLVWLVLQEGLVLTFLGFLLGILFSRFGLFLVSAMMKANYHYEFSNWLWLPEETWLLMIALAIGFIAALIPAIHVFRINISKTLANA